MTGSHIRSLTTIAAALALVAVATHAQSPSLPSDGRSLSIERSTDIPPPLLAAMRKAECRQDDALLLAFPIELFRPSPASSPMAIVPCAGGVLSGRAFMFDRDQQREPEPVAFPVMAFPGRVSASETPGVLSWNPYARTLTAVEGNDECDGVVARHTYRHDDRRGGDDLNGFALAKVERGKLGCGDSENWQVVWEASK